MGFINQLITGGHHPVTLRTREIWYTFCKTAKAIWVVTKIPSRAALQAGRGELPIPQSFFSRKRTRLNQSWWSQKEIQIPYANHGAGIFTIIYLHLGDF